MFASIMIRKAVRDYMKFTLLNDWIITEISTFTATKKRDGSWRVFVEAHSTNDWTNGHFIIKDGRVLSHDMRDTCFKAQKVDLLAEALGYQFIPHYETKIPAKYIKKGK